MEYNKKVERIRKKYNLDDDKGGWITINGTHIPLDKDGQPYGKVFDKIQNSSVKIPKDVKNAAESIRVKTGASISKDSMKQIKNPKAFKDAMTTIEKTLEKAGFPEGYEIFEEIEIHDGDSKGRGITEIEYNDGKMQINRSLINEADEYSDMISDTLRHERRMRRNTNVNTLIGEATGRATLDFLSQATDIDSEKIAKNLIERGLETNTRYKMYEQDWQYPVQAIYDHLSRISGRSGDCIRNGRFSDTVSDAFADVATNGDVSSTLSRAIVESVADFMEDNNML